MPRIHQSAAKHEQISVSRLRHGMLLVVSGILLTVAGFAFAVYVPVRWLENQVLTSDNWAAYASKLPKNYDVSWALADVITKQIFKNVPIEQRVSEALPPRAAFLAGSLSDQLQGRTTNIVQKTVSSDTFGSLWAGANRLAMERFLSNARMGQAPLANAVDERFNIDLSAIRPILQQRLVSESSISPALQERSRQAIAVTADLQTRRERLWQAVRTTDFIYAVLPALFIMSTLGFLVFASHRRRAVITLASVIIGLLLLELILVKYVSQQVVDQVRNAAYIPAVSYIYDSLVASLRAAIGYSLVLWLVVLIVGFIAGPARWAVGLRRFLNLDAIPNSRPVLWWYGVRASIARYRFVLWGVILGAALVYLAFFAAVSSIVLVNSLLLVLAGIFLVQLLADLRMPAAKT